MAVSGTHKAAMLLASLDSATAAELLKATRPEKMTEIAAELAYLKAHAGPRGPDAESAKEFYGLLRGKARRPDSEDFVKEVLENAVGKDKSPQVLEKVRRLVASRDPFLPVRSAAVVDLAKALEGESPQVAALVLAELPPGKSAQLLPLLSDSVRAAAVQGMAGGEDVSPETALRVAGVVRKRLAALALASASAGPAATATDRRPQQLRKVAVLLRSLAQDLRESMLKALKDRDSAAGADIQRLMVLWEDLAMIGDRSMQAALRGMDSKRLALALVSADPAVNAKIRKNISERAGALIDEEASLITSPKAQDIQQAREAILETLRQMNVKGELAFEDKQDG